KSSAEIQPHSQQTCLPEGAVHFPDHEIAKQLQHANQPKATDAVAQSYYSEQHQGSHDGRHVCRCYVWDTKDKNNAQCWQDKYEPEKSAFNAQAAQLEESGNDEEEPDCPGQGKGSLF